MSFDALAWAAKCKPGNLAAKMVLLGLANFADEHGCAYPSTAALADFGDMDHKTATVALDRLVELRLIEDSGQRAGRTKQIKVYRLLLQSQPKVEAFQKRKPSGFPGKGPQKRGTDTVKEPVIGESETREAAILALPQWAAFKAMRTQIKKPLNPTAVSRLLIKLIALADDGYPPGGVLDQSTEHCWQGVFKIEEREDGRTINRPNLRSVGGPRPDPTLAIVRAAIEAQRQSGGDYR